MTSFDVLAWLENRRRQQVKVERTEPQEVACWTRTSVNEGSRTLYGDRTGLCAFTGCHPPTNLYAGYPDDFVRKPGDLTTAGIEVVLSALRTAGVQVANCNVVSFRNNFNKMFLTPLNPEKGWVVDACALQGLPTVFLDIRAEEHETYPNEDLYMYYGYKFEALATGQHGAVDSTSEFGMVVSTTLGDLNIMLGCEIDCYDPSTVAEGCRPELKDCLELKTSRFPASDRQRQNAQRFKYPKWWLQSCLGGIRRIVVGYWKEDGVLNSVQSLDTHALPELALQGLKGYHRRQIWKPDRLLSFGLELLQWIRSSAAERRDEHLRFRYVPGNKTVTMEPVQDGDLVSRVSALISADGWKNRAQGEALEAL